MAISNYRQLEVWKKAMAVAEAVYAAGRRMPKQEEYRLTAQMLRAAVSIPANIAEGHNRGTRKDYAHFTTIARGSTAELETLLMLAERTTCLSTATVQPILSATEEVGRMLTGLHGRLSAPRT